MGEIIYQRLDKPECAYVLKEGSIIYELGNGHSFEASGRNLVFGAGEILISSEERREEFRHLTVKKGPGCQLTTIPKENILKLMSSFNIGYNVAKHIATVIRNLQKISSAKNKELGVYEKVSQEYCTIFAEAIVRLLKEFESKRFPWLEELANKYRNSLTAVKGMSFLSISNQKKLDLYSENLDKYNKRYPPGAVICKQGDVGEEMYILVQGGIKVLIDDNEITKIRESGEVIGEMALLLSEPRTATMVSLDNTVLSIIKKTNLKEVSLQNKEFFFKMSSTLARRELDLFNLITNLEELIQQDKEEHSGPDIIIGNKYREDLKMLRDDLKNVYAKTDLDWVYDLALDISEKMNTVREKYQKVV